jgi:transcriptional regulator with XRE-family HTH domain
MPHWTAENDEAFAHAVSADFVAQIEKTMESAGISQATLAQKLEVSEGAVSKILNNPQNLKLRTMITYAKALDLKISVVAYNDADPNNERGPINSEVFSACWENSGKPRDFWDLQTASAMTNNVVAGVFQQHAWAPMEISASGTYFQAVGFSANPSYSVILGGRELDQPDELPQIHAGIIMNQWVLEA